jgi:transposase InsO family protein
VWVADITYIPLKESAFAYLALLLDLCSRRVVGWSLAEQMTETLVLDALGHAIRDRQPAAGLVHHSDRGGQYASQAYRAVLHRAEFRQSMSRAANCYDNAFMESCFGTVKTELEMTEYQHSRQARQDIASYLAYYNHEGAITPVAAGWRGKLGLEERASFADGGSCNSSRQATTPTLEKDAQA